MITVDTEDFDPTTIINTPFYQIAHDIKDAYVITITGYPIKKTTIKHPHQDIIQYIYPTRKLFDEDGYLLNDNHHDEILIFVQCKPLGNKLRVWDSVSYENVLIHIPRLDVYLTSLIKKTYHDYTEDKTNKLVQSLRQQILKLFEDK